MLRNLAEDVRFAVRMVKKDPRFTAAAVVALALGIGVNNSVFAIINAAIFKDVPFEDAHQLMAVRMVNAEGRVEGLPALDYRDYVQSVTSLSGLSADTAGAMNLSGETEPAERFRGAYVSANTFALLRVAPVLGRDFRPEDDQPDAPAVVMLGHGAWQRRYGGDPAVLGRSVRINDRPAVIIGVMPAEFRYPFIAEMWQPLALAPALADARRGTRNLGVVGRLADSGDLAKARAEVDAIAARLAREFPETNRNLRAIVTPLKDTRPDTTPMLLTMMGAVGFVLLIACANLANLMLARSAHRTREVAIRASLGATRWRIVRQLLIECVLLAVIGGVLGLALSRFGVQQISVGFDIIEPGAAPGSTRPYWYDPSMDGMVFAFVGLLCMFTSVAFGLIPAVHVSRIPLVDTLKEGGRFAGGRRARRWTSGLMIAELALTLVLLTGAGLLWRNFLALYRAELPIDTAGVITADVALPVRQYATAETRRQFFARLDERLRTLPGVSSATLASQVPMVSFPGPPRQVAIQGRAAEQRGLSGGVGYVGIGTRYFETLGIEILRGRSAVESDGLAGQEGAIVNQQFVDLFFAGGDPIGQRIQLSSTSPPAPPTPWLTIVGVTPTLPRLVQQRSPAEPVVYVPLQIEPVVRSVSLIARTTAGLPAVTAALRDEVRTIDANLPLYAIETLDTAVRRTRMGVRLVGTWFGVLAIIALVVAGVGLGAITAHAVAERTREVGVRMALGARATQVIWLFMRRVAIYLAAGVSLGVAGALAVGQLLQFYIVRTSSRDPLTILTVTVVLIAVAIIASLLPARRATRVDPAVALRAE